VKDLRTWNATVHAAVTLAGMDLPASKRGKAAAVRAMLAEVSEHLGNTPAVARRSYVDPRVITRYEKGRTIGVAIRRAGSTDSPGPPSGPSWNAPWPGCSAAARRPGRPASDRQRGRLPGQVRRAGVNG